MLKKRQLISLLDMGVDIIFGSHLHVVQPSEIRSVMRDGKEEEVFVLYSLGNFISNQRWQYADSGLIAHVHIEKNLKTERTEIKLVEFMPVWVHVYWEDRRKNTGLLR